MAKNPTGKGIDVSGWNGNIDWARVKTSGIDFAIIKMGNVYNSSGTVDLESTFRQNVAGCEKVGMPYGVYLYTYVKSPARMEQVMQYVVTELKQACKKMWAIPCYLDIEEAAVVSGGNTNTLKMVQKFADAIEKGGFKAGVYSSTYWWDTYLTSDWYDTKARWVADWGSRCDYTKSYGIWQFSENGRVNGISGNVDMNYAYFNYSAQRDAETALTTHEQVYTVERGDTWAKVAEKFKMKAVPGGIALLEYNNYKTGDAALVYKVITQKTIKIPPKWIPGDFNGDGKVTAADARNILRASAGLEDMTAAEKMRADVNSDGKVTADDARKALRESADLD